MVLRALDSIGIFGLGVAIVSSSKDDAYEIVIIE